MVKSKYKSTNHPEKNIPINTKENQRTILKSYLILYYTIIQYKKKTNTKKHTYKKNDSIYYILNLFHSGYPSLL